MRVSSAAIQIRRMSAADLERVQEIAADLPQAPHWTASAYVAAMDQANTPRRIALVAECDSSRDLDSCESIERQTAGAEQAAEKPVRTVDQGFIPEMTVGRGFIPGIRPAGSARALAPEVRCVTGFLVASIVAPEAELETIAVIAAGQRHGVGRLLMQALIDELRAQRIGQLTLEVRASNQTALGFYRKQGFEESGRRPRYYADPEEDAVLMKLKLG